VRAKITQATIRSMPLPAPGKKSRITDTDVRGFVALKTATGAVSFNVEYGARGRQKRRQLGNLPATKAKWSEAIDEARAAAKAWLGKWAEGTDPDSERRRRRETPTWGQWVEEYLEGVKARKKRPEEDIRYLKGTERGGDSPAWKRWGNRPLDGITARDVDVLMREIKADSGKISANRWWASVRACFETALREGVINANPAGMVRRFPENEPRTRTLDDAELKRLREAVAVLESAEERTLFTVLIETGCRRSEALTMRWENLNFEDGVLLIPSPKSGRPQAVPLPLSTVHALRSLDRYSEWVFPGRDPSKPRRDIRKLWARVKTAAKLEDINVHDIRRTYGLRVAKHSGILAAQKLLRHSSAAVTSRVYTPLGIDHLREIAEAVNQQEPAEVVPIGKTR
jgi:integrase